jgi:AcrR family transcriptional regulator
MPKVVPEYKAQARERIMAAARTVFARRGFGAVTMDDVADEVGVSKGALYLYFPTKIALLKGLQDQSRNEVFQAVRPLLANGEIAGGLARVVEEMVQGHDAAIWHGLLVQAGHDPELRAALDADRKNDLKSLRQFLQGLVRAGRLPKETEVAEISPIIATLLEGGAVRLMLGEEPAAVRRQLVRSLNFVLYARSVPAHR